MKLNFLKVLLLSLILLVSMSGCGTVKMLHIPEQKVQRDVSAHDINHAIEIALQKTRWKIIQNEKSKITASLGGRKWSINIAVVNTKNTYTIEYLSSKNLKYNQHSQKIHPAYNKYIIKLKRQIDLEIKHVKITKKLVVVKNSELEAKSKLQEERSTKNDSLEVEIW